MRDADLRLLIQDRQAARIFPVLGGVALEARVLAAERDLVLDRLPAGLSVLPYLRIEDPADIPEFRLQLLAICLRERHEDECNARRRTHKLATKNGSLRSCSCPGSWRCSFPPSWPSGSRASPRAMNTSTITTPCATIRGASSSPTAAASRRRPPVKPRRRWPENRR